MTDVERDDTRLKALRDAPEPEVGPVRELVVNKLWLWRKIGLVLGVPAGIWNTRKLRREDPHWQNGHYVAE